MTKGRFGSVLAIAVLSVGSISTFGQQNAPARIGAPNGEWRTYGGDLGSTRYAPLGQIDASNFSRLEVAWRFKTDILGPRPDFNLQATPLMVNGVLYTRVRSSSTAGATRMPSGLR